jgi:hypothetical protein
MTVGQLREEMSSREFMEWQVWYGRRQQAEELAQRRSKGRR